MITFLTELLSNKIFMSAIAGWASAQVLKTIINFCFTKTFDPERLFGSGGMPSSHSATVCALAAATAFEYSGDSFEFAIAAIVAIIVMYDARGVRRETGTQAVVLNHFIEYFSSVDGHKFDFGTDKLKELVGHTPLQVAAGAALGVVVAFLMTLL